MATITTEATYEDGVLKPVHPLPLKEHEKVQITVQARDAVSDDEAERIVRGSHGILGWTGGVDPLRQLASDPELDPQENS